MPTNPAYDEYVKARRAYHTAGKACKGTPPDSPERRAYAEAKAAYQTAGERLSKSRA